MDSISQKQVTMESAEEVHDESVSESGFNFPYWTPACRRFSPDASFFKSGSMERELLAKQIALDLNEDERYHLEDMEDAKERYRYQVFYWRDELKRQIVSYWRDTRYMKVAQKWSVFCPIVGCGTRLNSFEDFEDHYNARHTASCSVCSRVYPTSRLLSIHVSEAHDSFFQAKVARGIPSYECLVEGCGLKLKSYKSRQQHLVDKHKFPTSFEFFKKKSSHPSKKQRQKYQRKQAKVAGDNSQKRDDGDGDDKMEVEETMNDLALAVSKLSTSDSSPSSISFGRRHTRGLTFLPRSVQCGRKHEASSAGTKRT